MLTYCARYDCFNKRIEKEYVKMKHLEINIE